jgi:tetratricopeptide (TPR) repeat protein
LTQTAFAQRGGNNDEPPPAQNTIDQRTGEILTAAIEFINNDQTTEARAKLGELDLARLSPYERSRVEQMLASLDMNEANYSSARTHLQAAIDSGGLNDQELSQSSYAIAQSWIPEEKWAEGAAALETWIQSATEVGSAPYYLLAVAYYQQDKYDEALPHARKAVELTNPPQEGWLQMLQAILLQKEDYKGALVVLKQMVSLFPDKKVYWMQLSNVYATLEDFSNALAIMQFANYNGMVTEDAEIRRLGDMMMVQEMPFQAAELMEAAGESNQVQKDVKYYESLANSWIAAREYRRALPVLGEAAKLADNGNTYIRIAEVNVQLSEWEAAAAALKSGIDKGGLRDESQAQLLMGMALYYQDKFSEARPYLERARSGTNTKNTANGFLQLIESRSN